jgi:hypothetical protein
VNGSSAVMPTNRGGATPTTVTGAPFTVSVEPITPGSLPNSWSQAACEITPTAAVAGSPGALRGSPAPSTVRTPRTEK